MSDNNSTVNNNNSLTIDCGVRNYCYNSQVCFAAPEGPICGNVNSNITTYSWKLNSAVFPPIEYIGSTIGRKQRDPCEMFDYNLWSDENKSWLLTFFYQNWNLTNPIPPGSFVRPLDFIGSCSNIVISATDISADGNITVTNTTCINDGFIGREIDPETGEIITISTAGGRLRRGTSILNRGASLNRSNSIRTLPPYSVVDEERPPSSSNGIVNSIAQFFFPPGELPPPLREMVMVMVMITVMVVMVVMVMVMVMTVVMVMIIVMVMVIIPLIPHRHYL